MSFGVLMIHKCEIMIVDNQTSLKPNWAYYSPQRNSSETGNNKWLTNTEEASTLAMNADIIIGFNGQGHFIPIQKLRRPYHDLGFPAEGWKEVIEFDK